MNIKSALWGLIQAVLTAILAAFATICTGAFGYWNKDREQDIQMVNIALSMLGGPVKDSPETGRRFAIRVLEKYAKVEVPDEEFDIWAKVGTLSDGIYRPVYYRIALPGPASTDLTEPGLPSPDRPQPGPVSPDQPGSELR
jgi:hypothetical protein